MQHSLRDASILLVLVLFGLQLPSVNRMAVSLAKSFIPPTTLAVQRFLPTTSRLSSFVSRIQYPLPRTFTTTNSNMAPGSNAFFDAVKGRRTIYQLSNESTIPDSRIQELVKEAVLHTPSAFNSQTTRMVLLLKEAHTKMWDVTTEIYKQQLPEESFKHAEQRFDGFRAAYGTVRLGRGAIRGLLYANEVE